MPSTASRIAAIVEHFPDIGHLLVRRIQFGARLELQDLPIVAWVPSIRDDNTASWVVSGEAAPQRSGSPTAGRRTGPTPRWPVRSAEPAAPIDVFRRKLSDMIRDRCHQITSSIRRWASPPGSPPDNSFGSRASRRAAIFPSRRRQSPLCGFRDRQDTARPSPGNPARSIPSLD